MCCSTESISCPHARPLFQQSTHKFENSSILELGTPSKTSSQTPSLARGTFRHKTDAELPIRLRRDNNFYRIDHVLLFPCFTTSNISSFFCSYPSLVPCFILSLTKKCPNEQCTSPNPAFCLILSYLCLSFFSYLHYYGKRAGTMICLVAPFVLDIKCSCQIKG